MREVTPSVPIPHVVLAADVDGVLDVADEVLGGRLTVAAEEGHEVDAYYATPLGEKAQLLVGLVARQVGEGRATGVGDGHGLLREGDGVRGGTVAAVAEIDEQALRVHRLDHLLTEAAQTGVAGLQTAVAQKIAPVVGELDDAHAEAAEDLDPVEIFAERCRILESRR